jgi:hypothetical protein
MQNGGANFTEYSNVNQFLVSLNGILQSPTDSFTVSGSTITFASNLVTGDVIDFIIVLGNSLDVGVPSDNTVSTAKIVDGAITSGKLASGVGGKVLQVVSTTKTDTFTSSGLASGAEVAITGLSASITPSSASNKILIMVTLFVGGSGNVGTTFLLKRASTDILVGDTAGSRKRATFSSGKNIAGYEDTVSASFTGLDSPSTTSSTTYSVSIFNSRGESDSFYINRGSSDTDNSVQQRTASTITLMEIAS